MPRFECSHDDDDDARVCVRVLSFLTSADNTEDRTFFLERIDIAPRTMALRLFVSRFLSPFLSFFLLFSSRFDRQR